MMRMIKFRGEKYSKFTGIATETIYSSALKVCDDGETFFLHGGQWRRARNVAQLLGADKKGREVYEGDEVKPARAADDSLNFRATMYDMRALDEGKIISAEDNL